MVESTQNAAKVSSLLPSFDSFNIDSRHYQVTLAQKYKREEVENLLKRKFFTAPSFEIYGGVSGFYDYGPLGCAVKNNIEQIWRNHFVLEEDMLEVGCTNLTLSTVLKTSGHVDKFEDLMVKDTKTGTPRRADKLIQEYIAREIPKLTKKKKTQQIEELEKLDEDVENFGPEEIDAVIAKYGIKDPDTGNPLTKAEPFNLMFDTQIGPTGQMKGYLRPETAQGIFINFKRLLEFNNGRMPFAAAIVGLGFRNEISPRQGLLRVREFAMAEIEHFVDENDKSHPKFESVADEELSMYSAED